MLDRNRRGRVVMKRPRLYAMLATCLAVPAVAATIMAAPAMAAAPTPVSLTNCGGSLAPDPSGPASGEPNLLDYTIQCDTDITAYTIIVDRQSLNDGNLDDYNPAPSVFDSDGVTPNATEAVTCEGTTPSSGINCNLGVGGVLSAWNFAEGSVDPIEPYCKYLPKGAKPGTPAVPQAIVQVIVTDNTGAQDGPFDLGLAKRCPKVPNVVHAKKPTGKGAKNSGDRSKGKRKGRRKGR